MGAMCVFVFILFVLFLSRNEHKSFKNITNKEDAITTLVGSPVDNEKSSLPQEGQLGPRPVSWDFLKSINQEHHVFVSIFIENNDDHTFPMITLKMNNCYLSC